jgi:tubulin polyglutamylase TTLL5
MEEIDYLISILNKREGEENCKPKTSKEEELTQNSFKFPSLVATTFYKQKNTSTIQGNSYFPNKLLPNVENIKLNRIRYLDFRPLVDIESTIKCNQDYGYYFRMAGNECQLIKNTLEDNGFIETTGKDKEWTIMWSSCSIKNNLYNNLKKFQKVNHFPRSVEITRKDLLYKNLSKLESLFPNNSRTFSFLPKSYILPNEHKFLAEEMEKEPNSIWILKPVASSQGRGISLIDKVQDVCIIFIMFIKDSKPI